MATYRCLSCGGIWVSPQRGLIYYHTCPLEKITDYATGARVPWPNRRDENIIQEKIGGPVHMKAPGLGRELLDEGDALTGITDAQLKALQARPAIGPSPRPEDDPNKERTLGETSLAG